MFKIALCQMMCSSKKEMEENKSENIRTAEKMVREAAENGAQIAVLPEIWNCPYTNKCFRPYSELENGRTVKFMSELAAQLNIYLVGGSIPELTEDDKVYNTAFVFDRKGNIIAKHRKAHLFDIDVPGRITFKESDTFTAGDKATLFETEFGRMGLAVCFDMRFPELFRKMTLGGAKVVFLPASFNMSTGPAHWDIVIRTRAIDNQLFVAACAPARNEESFYVGFGNSCVAGPWGNFIAHTDEKESIVYAEIDLDEIEKVREQLPILAGRRPELY